MTRHSCRLRRILSKMFLRLSVNAYVHKSRHYVRNDIYRISRHVKRYSSLPASCSDICQPRDQPFVKRRRKVRLKTVPDRAERGSTCTRRIDLHSSFKNLRQPRVTYVLLIKNEIGDPTYAYLRRVGMSGKRNCTLISLLSEEMSSLETCWLSSRALFIAA